MFVADVTSSYALFSVQGPHSRNLLANVVSASLSNEDFPYLTAKEVDIHRAVGFAFRMSFVGELGWELYVPSEFAVDVFDRLMENGAEVGMVLAGMETLESTRTEAGRRDYGLDMENTDTPLEAGVGFAVDFDKPGGFVGREALLRQREQRPLRSRLVQFRLHDPEPLLYGEEPILMEGERVGYLRSGAYGHTVGAAVGMGYVEVDVGVTASLVSEASFEIVVASKRYPAAASLKALYDPTSDRVRM